MNLNFVYVAYGDEHVGMGVKSMETAKEHHPSAEFMMYVDKEYDVLSGWNYTVRPDLFEYPWMVTNVMAQADWMLRLGETDNYTHNVFLDNDIIMRKPIPELEQGVDVFVTWRNDVGKLSETQPYNYGVLIVESSVEGIRFMVELERRVMQLQPSRQKWYGNQIALRELAGVCNEGSEIVTRNLPFEVKIQQLPGRKWNWSPPMEKLKQTASDKIFIHLKGDRKEAMDYYYDLVMNA